ncbi:hypothetical protein ACSQ67_023151 [Phaseolus vulgaris]
MLKRDVEERQVATEILKKEGEVEVREWLLFDGKGEMELVEAGKDAIMRRTGLSACDLDKLLDPLLSYPSIFLGRERAFIINLEHVKAIITAKEFLLLNSGDPSITPFVYEFQAWILRHYQDSSSSKHYAHPDPDSEPDHNHDAIKILPFEFVALESCLEASGRTKTLEQEAHSALDKLTSKISTLILNWKRLNQIKIRLVDITECVQKVRNRLEQKLAKQDSHGTPGSTYRAVIMQIDVKELRMLLKDYFVQMDDTLKKLSMVCTPFILYAFCSIRL